MSHEVSPSHRPPLLLCTGPDHPPRASPRDAAGEPGEGPEQRQPHPPPSPGHASEMTIDELGNFRYDPEKGGLPDDVRRLDGATVRLKGYMIPTNQAEDIRQFAMTPSLVVCRFCQPPQIHQMVVVNCPPGKAVSYFGEPISVEGKLKVKERREDGYVVSIFELDATSIRAAK